MLVKSMAIELAPAIRTVGVSPGQVCWPEDYTEEKRAHLQRRIPMERAGTPREIATLVRFLAVEGTYINGAVIPMDGGLSLRYG
jgi:NAD(P)-dependent dehydrogenase (short-subunit alcohol dehydrogenase family)